MNKRFWEIDFLRGLAIIMMIIFHIIYDLNYFAGYNFSLHSGFWLVFAHATAAIFIFLVGVSLTISYSRTKKYKTLKELSMKYLSRGLKIFSMGLVITLATWIFSREGFIIFGILHFIGISVILAYLFLRFKYQNLLFGIIFIIIGMYLRGLTVDFYWLTWLGLRPYYFYTFDYFPIFPWFGVILVGLFFGNLFYPNAARRFNIFDISEFQIIKSVCFLGKHSLLIYLAHQPILILLLYFLVI